MVPSGALASQTVTVTGAAPGDIANVTDGLATGGVQIFAKVTAADTVTAWVINFTTGAIDLASTTLLVEVTKA